MIRAQLDLIIRCKKCDPAFHLERAASKFLLMVIRFFLTAANKRNAITQGLPISFANEITKVLTLGCYYNTLQKRLLSKSRRVQDRSKHKRVHDLEIATERWKVVSKILFLMDVLKKEPEQVIPLKNMEQYQQQINLIKPHKVADFVQKSPKIFDLYKDQRGVVWCGFTRKAESLVEEERRLIEEYTETAVEHVTRLLMMSVEKRLPLYKIANFRRDFGLPLNFRKGWIHSFPEHFKVVKIDDSDYLELNSWNPAWAITEVEKKARPENMPLLPSPGILCLPFPMKFPQNYRKRYKDYGKIENFQNRCYLSPYADAKGLIPGSQEFNKRAVAMMHEILSFTIEKRLVTDHLTHFRQEFMMPQKLMRLLLKHYGIFYVSERGKRFSVFLTEAYEGACLLSKCPLVLWKETILRLTGYRGHKTRVKKFGEFSDIDEDDLFDGELDSFEDEESMGVLKDPILAEDSEMDVRDLFDDA